jgi:hypothetical protein
MLRQGKEQQQLLLLPPMAPLAAARLPALCPHSRCCRRQIETIDQIIDSWRLSSSETPALQHFRLCAVFGWRAPLQPFRSCRLHENLNRPAMVE